MSRFHPNIHRVTPPSPAPGEFKTILSTLLNRLTSLFIHVQRNSLKTQKQRWTNLNPSWLNNRVGQTRKLDCISWLVSWTRRWKLSIWVSNWLWTPHPVRSKLFIASRRSYASRSPWGHSRALYLDMSSGLLRKHKGFLWCNFWHISIVMSLGHDSLRSVLSVHKYAENKKETTRRAKKLAIYNLKKINITDKQKLPFKNRRL